MNAIEIRQLQKSYPGFDLGPLDLSLPQGCIMGLIGENGAGKTTTIRLILDMLQRDGGSIRLLGRGDGEDVMLTREEDHSILISSHILSDLEKLCDYIAFLHKGQLLLCEEKDLLLSEYCILRCTAAELNALPKEAIKGRKENPYGVTAIVRRDAAPAGANTSPISIEELFVFMVKEA